jgi:CHASE2 domain-containing sensor protein
LAPCNSSALRGAVPPGPEIALVMVDDRSSGALGRWPLSHRLFARALDTFNRDGAKTVVFDLLFTQPEQRPAAPNLQNWLSNAKPIDTGTRVAARRLQAP